MTHTRQIRCHRASRIISSCCKLDEALVAADNAIAYAAASLPRNPLASGRGIAAQALFDWAAALEMRGLTHRHRNYITRSMKGLNDAEQAMMLILAHFPMDENYSALAGILHNRSNSRLTAGARDYRVFAGGYRS